MAAKQTSLSISEATYAVVRARRHDGESTSAAINRMVLELERTDTILAQVGAIVSIQRLIDKLDKFEARL